MNRPTKNLWFLVFLMLVALCLPGCPFETSRQRIEALNQVIEVYDSRSIEAVANLEAAQESLRILEGALAEAQTTGDEELIAKAQGAVDSMVKAIEKIKEVKTEADRVLSATRAKVKAILEGTAEPTFADEVEILIPAAQTGASFLPPPWNVVAGGVIAAVAAFYKRKTDNLGNAVVQLVAGTKKAMESEAMTNEAVVALKNAMAGTQTPKTEVLVKKVKTTLPPSNVPPEPTLTTKVLGI